MLAVIEIGPELAKALSLLIVGVAMVGIIYTLNR